MTIVIFQNFYRNPVKYAKMGQNWPILGQNTRNFDFPVEISVITEISIWIILFFCECGYFVIYRFFLRPLDKKVPKEAPPFIFESLLVKNRK